ncbi:MAG TPA: hypothetical protein VKR22_02990 [Acidimicrobiales bacterium]|nr:hypothetical protein [Acidimicrobiales bacterium]
MAERLLRVALAMAAVALALEFIVHVVMRLLPQLVGMAAIVAVVVLGLAIHRYRRSHW